MYVIKGFDHLGALLQACKTAFTCLHKQTENCNFFFKIILAAVVDSSNSSAS